MSGWTAALLLGGRYVRSAFKRAFVVGSFSGAVASALALSGCVTYIPVEEYTLARAAYDSARDAEAARFAQAMWFNAEQNYREGQKAFRDRNYGEAKSRFVEAQKFAEQAENAARVARHQSGQVVP